MCMADFTSWLPPLMRPPAAEHGTQTLLQVAIPRMAELVRICTYVTTSTRGKPHLQTVGSTKK